MIDGWVRESGYGQYGAICVAYAVRTWLTDDPQQTVWAARQVNDAAEYAVRHGSEGLQIRLPCEVDPPSFSPVVHVAVAAIESDLLQVETSGVKELAGAPISGRATGLGMGQVAALRWTWIAEPEDFRNLIAPGGCDDRDSVGAPCCRALLQQVGGVKKSRRRCVSI
jgi:hypothetical protein